MPLFSKCLSVNWVLIFIALRGAHHPPTSHPPLAVPSPGYTRRSLSLLSLMVLITLPLFTLTNGHSATGL